MYLYEALEALLRARKAVLRLRDDLGGTELYARFALHQRRRNLHYHRLHRVRGRPALLRQQLHTNSSAH